MIKIQLTVMDIEKTTLDEVMAEVVQRLVSLGGTVNGSAARFDPVTYQENARVYILNNSLAERWSNGSDGGDDGDGAKQKPGNESYAIPGDYAGG